MDTLQQLAFENNNIPVGSGFGEDIKKAAELSTNPYILKIAKTYQLHYDFEVAFENASKGSLIMAEDRFFLEYNIRSRYTDK